MLLFSKKIYITTKNIFLFLFVLNMHIQLISGGKAPHSKLVCCKIDVKAMRRKYIPKEQIQK